MTFWKVLVALSALVLVPLCFALFSMYEEESIQPIPPTRIAVVEEWIDLLLVLTEETFGFTPPVAARAFAYAGISVYESVRFADPQLLSLAGQVEGLSRGTLPTLDSEKTYQWDVVANANLAEIARLLYPTAPPTYQTRIDELEKEIFAQVSQGVSVSVAEDSVAFGRRMAHAVALYAASDGQADAYRRNFPMTFKVAQREGVWEKTPNAYKQPLQPYWGNTRTFIKGIASSTLPVPPPVYSTREDAPFFGYVQEVYEATAQLSTEERAIAQFWSDEPGNTATPSGHSLSILRQVLELRDTSLDDSALAFAKLGIGLHDSFVSCWYAKFFYNTVRPVTVIREHIDPNFQPLLETPPFPEYPSGHSVQSAAAAAMLADLFGEEFTLTDRTHEGRSDILEDTRTFNSFAAMAEEAGISRLYGGIHFRPAIEEGLKQGRDVGHRVNQMIQFKDPGVAIMP